jgi:hypothetical protein
MNDLISLVEPPVDRPLKWRHEEFADTEKLAAFAAQVRATLPMSDYEHDPEWMALGAGRALGNLRLLVQREGERLCGLASFYATDQPVDYNLGGFTLFKPRVRCLRLKEGVIGSGVASRSAIVDCFTTVSGSMKAESALFLESVPVDSDLYALLRGQKNGIRSRFYVLAWNPENWHCRIRWSGNVEAYLGSIGRESRKDLRRCRKAVFSDPELKCEVKRFEFPSDIDAFLRDGALISERTWQKKALGDAISFGGGVERMIRFAAARGGFLGYILYINDEPAAFQYCFVYGRTCTMEKTGYDPAWAKHQVGVALFVEILLDLEKNRRPIEVLDYLTYGTTFKSRTTNDKRKVQNFFLFKRSLRGSGLYWSLMPVHHASKHLIQVLERFQLKDKVKRLLGRHVSE